MTRSTSIETFHEIEDNGLLSKKRMEIYKTLYTHGPMTARETMLRTKNQTNQSGRFTELREMGVIAEIGEKLCGVTGKKAILWQTTDSLPKDFEPSKTKKQKIDEIVNEARILWSKLPKENRAEFTNLMKKVKRL